MGSPTKPHDSCACAAAGRSHNSCVRVEDTCLACKGGKHCNAGAHRIGCIVHPQRQFARRDARCDLDQSRRQRLFFGPALRGSSTALKLSCFSVHTCHTQHHATMMGSAHFWTSSMRPPCCSPSGALRMTSVSCTAQALDQAAPVSCRTERQAANKRASLGSRAEPHLSVCKDRRPAVRVAKAPDAPPRLGGAFHVRCQLSTRSGLCYIRPLDRHRGLGPVLPRTGTHGYCSRTMHGTIAFWGCMQVAPH